jgi:hypothetical protein
MEKRIRAEWALVRFMIYSLGIVIAFFPSTPEPQQTLFASKPSALQKK